MSEEALQIAEERRGKVKGDREIYTQLHAEFQRIIRRDKEAFLNEQCTDIGKTTIECERLEISLRKLETSRECFLKNGHNKGAFIVLKHNS